MDIETAYELLYGGALVVLAVLIGVMLIRSVLGPRITDRILCINMIGTMVICMLSILSRLLDESWLVDVALIYAMLNFVAMLMITATYLPPDAGRENGEAEK